MKNVLRILMFVLIVGAVFFASDFLMKQNENYDSILNKERPTHVYINGKRVVKNGELNIKS